MVTNVNVTTQNLEPIRFDASPVAKVDFNADADWTAGLPVLTGRKMMLRELVKSDALSLLSMLSADEVAKFISPPPTTPKDSSGSSRGRSVNARRATSSRSAWFPMVVIMR